MPSCISFQQSYTPSNKKSGPPHTGKTGMNIHSPINKDKVYPKSSNMILSESTPKESRYSVTVLINIGGPQR